jgi:putative N-acetyltransferase (TIGR04045 family)
LAVAVTPEEIAQYYQIRREVFVVEQGLFADSDLDAHDREAIAIIARIGDRVAGVVRCYHHRGGVWFGGRLAVRREFRNGVNLGALLVRKAAAVMEARDDVRRFLATVQVQNVRFFERLGWVRLGRTFVMYGRKHQTMEKRMHAGEQ